MKYAHPCVYKQGWMAEKWSQVCGPQAAPRSSGSGPWAVLFRLCNSDHTQILPLARQPARNDGGQPRSRACTCHALGVVPSRRKHACPQAPGGSQLASASRLAMGVVCGLW